MIRALSSWLSHPAVDWGLGVFSLLAVLASVVLVPRFLATLPRDYLRSAQPTSGHSLALRVLRNVLGVVLALLGVAMLLLPGQGLLTLLVGVLLVDIPGKHALVVKILSRPKLLAIVNKLRAHRHAEPLESA
jgi:hypothetical protein